MATHCGTHSPHQLVFDAIEAAQDILREVYKIELIEKALDPLDDDDFLKIVDRVSRQFQGIASPIEVDHVSMAIDILDVDWEDLSPDQIRRITEAVNLALRPIPAKVLPKFNATYSHSFETMVKSAAKKTIQRFGLDVSFDFDQVDERVVDHAARSQAIYITNEYGHRFEEFDARARRTISDGLARGLRSAEISQNLARQCTNIVHGRSRSYYNVVANAGMNRSRTYGQLRSFEEAEITLYTIHAVLDEDTTDICRFMHGQTFSVSSGLQTIQSTEEGNEDVKNTQPWARTRRLAEDERGEKEMFIQPPGRARASIGIVEESGVGTKDKLGTYRNTRSSAELQVMGVQMPPFHGNCRTTVIPVVGDV